MKHNTCKFYKLLFIIGIVLLSGFLAYSSCVLQFMGNADDVGEVLNPYLHFGLGIDKYTFLDFFKLNKLIELFVYRMFGIQESSIYFSFFVQLFFCNVLTFLVATYYFNCREKISIIFVITFILIPASNGIRYHLYSTVGMLFVLLAVQRTEKLGRLKQVIISSIVVFYFLWTALDRALFMLSCLIPLVLYLVVVMWRNKENRNYILCFGCIGVSLLALLRIINFALVYFFDITFLTAFSGYGGASYASWSSLGSAWTEGISIFCDGLSVLWNIPISGGFVQANSIIWCIRIVLLVVALYTVVENMVALCKGKEVNSCIAISSISVIVVAFSYIFNEQMRGATNRDETARYMVIIQYLLVVLLCYKLFDLKKYLPKIEWKKRLIVNEYTLIGITAIFLIVSYSEPVFMGKRYFGDFDDEASREMVEFLKQENLEFGVGAFWKARQIMYYSGNEVQASCGDLENGNFELSGERDIYYFNDVDRKCNFFIVDKHYQWKMLEDDVLKYYGEPIKTKNFVDKAGTLSSIFVYDYDVRWKPEIYTDCLNCEIPLMLGKSRIHIKGIGLSENSIKLSSEDEFEYSINLVDNENMVIYIECMKPINIQISVIDDKCSIETLSKVCEYAALPMIQDSIYMQKGEQKSIQGSVADGTYKLIVRGERLDELDITFNGNIDVEECNSGELRRVYIITAEQKEEMDILLTKMGRKDSVINSIALVQYEDVYEVSEEK